MSQWQNETGLKRFLSYFYNQTAFVGERKIKRLGDDFDFNPFSSNDTNLLGLNSSFRNSLFFNRGKQKHSMTYTFLMGRIKNLLSVGSQENSNQSHHHMKGLRDELAHHKLAITSYAVAVCNDRESLLDKGYLAPLSEVFLCIFNTCD